MAPIGEMAPGCAKKYNKYFFKTFAPGAISRIITVHPRTKKCRKYIYSRLRVFSVLYTRIFSALLCQGSSLSCLISGVTWHALLSLPHYRARAFVLIARKEMFRIKFPSLAPSCVELVFIYATCQYSTQHAGCKALSAVRLYTDVFVSGLDLDPNELTRHTF